MTALMTREKGRLRPRYGVWPVRAVQHFSLLLGPVGLLLALRIRDRAPFH